MTRSLLPLIIASSLFAVGLSPRAVEAAGVKGKTYNVTVTKNSSREFDDFYAFQSDGTFVSLRGGFGVWQQTNLLLFSIWTADFRAGAAIRVSFVGVQVGSQIAGFGSNADGDVFHSVGTEGEFDGNLEEEDTNLYITD
jgi:hypothetical protein